MGRRLSAEEIARYDARPELFSWLLDFAHLPRGLGRKTWRVGGSELVLDFQLDERYLYVGFVRSGWPTHPVRRSLCLAEVYAIAATARVRTFKPSELKRWKLRLLVAAGLLEPPPWRLPSLPSDAPTAAVETWRAVEAFKRLRMLDGETPEDPFPLSAPWFAEWAGLDVNPVRAGKEWLERHGYLSRAGTYPAHPKPGVLWAVRT